MVSKKCVHFIKANKAVKEFVREIVTYPIDINVYYFQNNSIDYGATGSVFEDDEIDIYIPHWCKANYKNDFGGKCFRKDFVNRCPMAKGFSDVVISLLHEIGHTMTKDALPKNYNRELEERKARINAQNEYEIHTNYFAMKDEMLATNWAIMWLCIPENRKLAKAFEKKFFACFE